VPKGRCLEKVGGEANTLERNKEGSFSHAMPMVLRGGVTRPATDKGKPQGVGSKRANYRRNRWGQPAHLSGEGTEETEALGKNQNLKKL